MRGSGVQSRRDAGRSGTMGYLGVQMQRHTTRSRKEGRD